MMDTSLCSMYGASARHLHVRAAGTGRRHLRASGTEFTLLWDPVSFIVQSPRHIHQQSAVHDSNSCLYETGDGCLGNDLARAAVNTSNTTDVFLNVQQTNAACSPYPSPIPYWSSYSSSRPLALTTFSSTPPTFSDGFQPRALSLSERMGCE